jgi:AraC-like DNA-binding protein
MPVHGNVLLHVEIAHTSGQSAKASVIISGQLEVVGGAANVAEAAWEVGFKDPSYFSKLYQEEFGEAPSTTYK